MAGAAGEPAGILQDPDLTIHVFPDQVHLASAFLSCFAPGDRCGIIADSIARLFGEIFDKSFELSDLVPVPLMDIVADADLERDGLPQVFNDPFKGGTAAAQMAGGVMGGTDAVKGDLGTFHLRLLQHFDDLRGQQIAVGDDPRGIFRMMLLCQRHQLFR